MNKWKILKITGFVFLGLICLLLLAVILIPVFFKDDIKAAMDDSISKSVKAVVQYDINQFGLSIIRNFPNITVSQENLRVIGKEEFSGDTLLAVKTLRITIDLWSVLFGDEMKVRSFYLDSPRIKAKVLKNGKANWDIAISAPKDTTKEVEEKKTEFNVSIRRWEIRNAYIVYDDAQTKVYTRIRNLSHTGSGNFNQDVFDLKTKTFVEKFSLSYDGSSYVEDKLLDIDMVLNINVPESKYTFRKNSVRVNDFQMGFEGFVQMIKNDILLDLQFKARENKFKNVLSLVPGMYSKDFERLKTSGNLGFGGFVKGVYNEKKMPAFNLDLKVSEGSFQYPALPTSVNNINLALMVHNKDGNLENTLIHLKQFHIDLGKNPVDAKAKIEGLNNMRINAQAKAALNLADISRMFPMDGMTLRGNFKLNLDVNGNYNAYQMPRIEALMNLLNGYVKTNRFPEALENITLLTAVKNPSGKYEDTQVKVENFQMILDKEPFEASAFFSNFKDIQYDVKAKGSIDLGKWTKIFPLEGMKLAGKIFADLQTKGKTSDAINARYDQLPTSGYIRAKDFSYYDKTYLPQGFKITQAECNFTPQSLTVNQMDGFLGKSDIHLTGTLSNYLAYALKPNEVIRGNMVFNSNKFDVNEWMAPASPTTTTTTTKTENKPVSTDTLLVQIPKNIDFTLNSTLQEIIYSGYALTNAKGIITVKDGVIKLDNLNFNAFKGSFIASGVYNPTDLKHPKYSFNFGIQNLPLSNAYQTFLAGSKGELMAKNIEGLFNSTFKISGELGLDMMPLYNQTLNGDLAMNVMEGRIKDTPILNRLNSLTSLEDMKEFILKDLFVKASIQNGRVLYQPFNVLINQYKMNVSGSNGVDGSLDFLLKLDVPLDKINIIQKTALSNLTGKLLGNEQNLKINFKVGGTYDKPTLQMLDSEGKIAKVKENIKEKIDEKTAQVKEKVNEVKEQLNEKKEEIRENINSKKAEILAKAKERAEKIKADARLTAEQMKLEADEKEKQTVEEASANGPLAKKAAEVTARKLKEATYKKADQLVAEADKQADKIIEEANKEAEKQQ